MSNELASIVQNQANESQRVVLPTDELTYAIIQRVIVEIKALHGLDHSHIAQVIGYLAVSGCEVGLLINFGERSLQWKRILPPTRVQDHKLNRQWLFVPEWLQSK